MSRLLFVLILLCAPVAAQDVDLKSASTKDKGDLEPALARVAKASAREALYSRKAARARPQHAAQWAKWRDANRVELKAALTALGSALVSKGFPTVSKDASKIVRVGEEVYVDKTPPAVDTPTRAHELEPPPDPPDEKAEPVLDAVPAEDPPK